MSGTRRSALTLVEVLVALALLALVLLPLVTGTDAKLAARTVRASLAGHLFAALSEHYLALSPDAFQAALDGGTAAPHGFAEVAVEAALPAHARGALAGSLTELAPRLFVRRIAHVRGHFALDRMDFALHFRDIHGPRWLRHGAIRRNQPALMALGFVRCASGQDTRSDERFHALVRELVDESAAVASSRLDRASGLLVPAYPEQLRRFDAPGNTPGPLEEDGAAFTSTKPRLTDGYVRPRFAPGTGIAH